MSCTLMTTHPFYKTISACSESGKSKLEQHFLHFCNYFGVFSLHQSIPNPSYQYLKYYSRSCLTAILECKT